jgi:hypothetical protein
MGQPHNVFISWSGERSRIVAQKLREWLPRVVQAAKPWMSDADIEKGARGLSEVTKALSTIRVGISCLSPDNLESPWLLFEAGALSKAIDDTSRLCTYLLDGLGPEDVKVPLGMFQATRATKEDTRKLIQTINLSVSEQPLAEDDLDEIFEAMWPSLGRAIDSLPRVEPTRARRRNTDDMIAEILEIVRAEANRKHFEPQRAQAAGTITGAQVRGIIAAVAQKQKFLSELVQHASRWELEGDELRLYFPMESRALAELLQAREPLQKLCAIATSVLELPVRVLVKLESKT